MVEKEKDIVTELRQEIAECKCAHDMPIGLMEEAADEIERLRAYVKNLQAQLDPLIDRAAEANRAALGQERTDG